VERRKYLTICEFYTNNRFSGIRIIHKNALSLGAVCDESCMHGFEAEV
jgi:hypothetical protein